MKTVLEWINLVERIVWGWPLLLLITGTGIYLTFRLRGVQIRHLVYAHKLAFTRKDKGSKGDISHFEALMTALAATIGIGSITGVATALQFGGVGSLFWMWVAACFGMAIKYAEGVLAIFYRETDQKGEMCGGPMYYLEKGVHSKFLGLFFAIMGIFAAIGTGNLVQSNSVAESMYYSFHVPKLVTGLVVMVCVAVPLFGGIKKIGKIAAYLVPTMACFYILGSLIIILSHPSHIIPAFASIFKEAWNVHSALGGAIGVTLMRVIQVGISRAIFSSESGLGSSSIAAAAAKTDCPSRQALVSMSSVFLTTMVVCTLTGLVILVSGVFDEGRTSGSNLAIAAFDRGFPIKEVGGWIVTLSLLPFAYSTILGWAYYGEKCLEYLMGLKYVAWYRFFFMLIVIPGSLLKLDIVWGFANIANALMAFPNLIGLLVLSPVVAKEMKRFEKSL